VHARCADCYGVALQQAYIAAMAKIESIPVPSGSLLAEFGPPAGSTTEPYRDCFMRRENGAVSLEQLIERFYCSWAFRPERIALGLIGRGASSEDARALARGEIKEFAAWTVIERRENEILLQDFQGATASWLSVRPEADGGTELLFGSWVGRPDRGVVKALMPVHQWYARVLLGGAQRSRSQPTEGSPKNDN